MAKLQIPSQPPGARPPIPNLLKSIIEFDQFDDWLPDPVYYDDQRLAESRAVKRIEQIWQAGELPVPVCETLRVPHAGRDTVPVLAMPLDARACTHGVIAGFAPRLVDSLEKNKVYGVDFHKESVPLFSPPGAGLPEVWQDAITAVQFTSGAKLQILDVAGFNRNATVGSLEGVLQRAGARPDETNFVRQIIQPGPKGLPSIDDAFAFLYNFYLLPVDQALVAGKTNFFRYRDEYFVLNDKGKGIVLRQLQKLGLAAHVLPAPDLNVQDEMARQVSADNRKVEKIISKIQAGELVAKYECLTWNDEDRKCQSDHYEVVYRSTEGTAAQDLFNLSTKHPLDAVQILPVLRALHRVRRVGVVLRPPFTEATTAFAEYRRNLITGHTWLREALATAVNAGSDWQVTWVAPLLSEVGQVRHAEIVLLRQILASPKFGQAAKTQARLALARGSRLPPKEFWIQPPAAASPYQWRAALLGARYLANRGFSAPWREMEQTATQVEPELKNYLISNIKEANT